jgi:two-component sensor histidine kinase
MARLGRVRIGILLNLAYSASFLLASVAVVLMVSAIMKERALAEAEEKATILMDRNLATHGFYSEILKPRLFEWTEPFRPEGYFEPSWMSSSYAVRQIQRYFGELDPTDYYMKDAALNARNPGNEADELERAFLSEVNEDPNLVARRFAREFEGIPYFVFMRRGELLEEGCLQCHGDPSRAPAGLLALYGAERGFGREAELGRVISAISIRIPISVAMAKVDRFTLQLSGLLVALLAAFFLFQTLLNRNLLFRPIALLRDKATHIASDERRLGETVEPPFGRELGGLAIAFNEMSTILKHDRDHLEERIEERGRDLIATNERLERDIEERKRTEALLSKALAENRALLRELQHRAKNNFMMIGSLIGLMAESQASREAQEALRELEVRVGSISELYSSLYSSGSFAEVDLEAYCSRILTAMSSLGGPIEMTSELEAVVAPVSVAGPVGLIIAELLTNALKHAFAGRDRGRIDLSLRREGDGARVEVSDDGIGLPADWRSPARPGTGIRILESLAEQIGGTLAAASDSSGTRFTLIFGLAPGAAASPAQDGHA